MNCTMPTDPQFDKYYQKHIKCLKLNGLQPKTVEAYSRAIRRIGNYFYFGEQAARGNSPSFCCFR